MRHLVKLNMRHQRVIADITSVYDISDYILCHLKISSKHIFLHRHCVQNSIFLWLIRILLCSAHLLTYARYKNQKSTMILHLSLPSSFSCSTEIQRYLPMITDQCIVLRVVKLDV